EARFSLPRLAGHEGDLPSAGQRAVQSLLQPAQLGLPGDEEGLLHVRDRRLGSLLGLGSGGPLPGRRRAGRVQEIVNGGEELGPGRLVLQEDVVLALHTGKLSIGNQGGQLFTLPEGDELVVASVEYERGRLYLCC